MQELDILDRSAAHPRLSNAAADALHAMAKEHPRPASQVLPVWWILPDTKSRSYLVLDLNPDGPALWSLNIEIIMPDGVADIIAPIAFINSLFGAASAIAEVVAEVERDPKFLETSLSLAFARPAGCA